MISGKHDPMLFRYSTPSHNSDHRTRDWNTLEKPPIDQRDPVEDRAYELGQPHRPPSEVDVPVDEQLPALGERREEVTVKKDPVDFEAVVIQKRTQLGAAVTS